jgi:hypothetical protein
MSAASIVLLIGPETFQSALLVSTDADDEEDEKEVDVFFSFLGDKG